MVDYSIFVIFDIIILKKSKITWERDLTWDRKTHPQGDNILWVWVLDLHKRKKAREFWVFITLCLTVDTVWQAPTSSSCCDFCAVSDCDTVPPLNQKKPFLVCFVGICYHDIRKRTHNDLQLWNCLIMYILQTTSIAGRLYLIFTSLPKRNGNSFFW